MAAFKFEIIEKDIEIILKTYIPFKERYISHKEFLLNRTLGEKECLRKLLKKGWINKKGSSIFPLDIGYCEEELDDGTIVQRNYITPTGITVKYYH